MGGIFSTPKPPAAPDPAATIAAQKEAQQVAQITPQGTLYYGSYDPATGSFTPRTTDAQMVTETPFQQQIRQGAEGLSLQLLGQLQNRPSILPDIRTPQGIESGLMPLQTDFGGDITRLEDATFNAVAQRLRPEFDRQTARTEQKLADMGLPIGSEAYNEEMNRINRAQGDQLSLAALDAVSAGRAEQDRLARLTAALRGQQYNEQTGLTSLEQQLRAQAFGEIGNLLGTSQPFTQFSTPQVDAAGIINQGYANQLGLYNTQMAGRNANMAALGSLAGVGVQSYFGGRK